MKKTTVRESKPKSLAAAVEAVEAGGDIKTFLPGVLADWQIRARLALPEGDPERLVISPHHDGDCPDGAISYGISSYGYDCRLGETFKVFTNVRCAVVDPKNFNPASFFDHVGTDCLIPPNSFALAESKEYVEIPEDCVAIVLGKSTYARCGINLNMTPLEPGWKGIITIEIANLTPLPARVYGNEGIGQILFFKGSAKCKRHYGNKRGAKYQHQKGLTLPRVKSDVA